MEKQVPHILIVDDDPNLIESMTDILRVKGYEPLSALTGDSALLSIEQFHIDVALIDLRLGDTSGMELLRGIKAHSPETECILLTGYATQNSAIDAVQMGAFGYFQKPFDIEQMLLSIQRALEKHAAAQALRESEEKYRLLVENAGEALYVVQNGLVVFANPMFAKIAELPAAELIGTSMLDFIPELKDRIAAIKNHKSVLRGKVENAQREFKVRLRSGTERWIKVNEVQTVWKGEPATLSYATDITERLQIEYQYKVIFDNSLEGIFQSTPNGRFIHVNPAMARIYGYSTPQEMVESVKNITDQIYVNIDERKLFVNLLQDNNFIENFEGQNRRKDGSIIWTSTNARRIRDANGNILYYEGFLQDITERKEAEKAVHKNEERYRLLFESAPVGIFSATVQGQVIEINPVALQILGSPSVEASKNINLLTFPLLVETGFSANFKTCIETGHPVFAEHSYTSKWGKSIFVQYRMNPISDISERIALIQVIMEDITERKQTDEALRRSEAQYRLLANNVSDVIWILDLETMRFTYVTPSVEQLRGFTVAEVLAQETSQTLTRNSAEYVQKVIPERIKAAEQGLRGYYLDEVEQPRKDGTTVWTETTTHYTFNAESSHWEVYGVSRDITERKQAEEALQMSESSLQAVLQSTADGILAVSRDNEVLYANERFAELWRIPQSVIASKDDSVLLQHILDQLSDPQSFLKKVQELYKSKEDSLDTLYFKDGRIFERLSHPMLLETKLRGRVWSFRDITERKHTEEALQNSEKRFRALIENGRDNISLLAPDGTLLWESPSTINTLGYAPNQFVGHSIFELTHPDDQDWIRDQYTQILQTPGKSQDVIFRLRHGDGTWRWIESTAANMLNEPSVQAIIINYRDITERKHAEEALANSEAELRALFSAMQDVVLVIDREGVYRKIAPTNPGLLVRSPNELLGKNLWEVFPAEQAETFMGVVQQVLQSQQTAHIEYGLDINTKPIWFETSISLMNADRTVWVARDITERRQIEQALKESQQSYQKLVEQIPGVIYRDALDEKASTLFISPQIKDLTGYATEEWLADPDLWPKLLHPDDRARVLAEQKRHLATGAQFKSDYRLLARDGRIVWVRDEAVSIRDSSGHPLYDQGVFTNITEGKHAEDLLRESEDRYHNLFEDSPISLLEEDFSAVKQRLDTLRRDGITDFHTYLALHPEVVDECAELVKIKDVNKAGLKIYRADSKNNMPKNLTQVLKSKAFEHFRNQLADIAEGQIHFSWEGINHAIDGSQIDVEVNWSVAAGFENDLSKVIVSLQDITERKQVEEALRASEERFKTIFKQAPLGIASVDSLTGHIYEVNPRFAVIAGRSMEEMENIDWMQITHPEDMQADLDNMALLNAGKINGFQMEKRYLHTDGTIVWINMTIAPLNVEDKAHPRHLCMIEDITERKQAERQRKETLQLLQATFSSLNEAVLIVDTGTRAIYEFNKTAETMFGYSHEELIGRDTEFLHVNSDTFHAFSEKLLSQLKQSDHFEFEFQMKRKNGEIFQTEHFGRPLIVEGHFHSVISVIRDITERKRADAELRESEERYHTLFDSMMDGIYRSTHAGKFVDINPAMVKMFGYSSKEEMLAVDIKKELYFALEERGSHILDTGQEETEEYRMRRKDGSEIWVEDHGYYIHDTQGKPIYHEGMLRDITARKLAEAALRAREEQYRTLVEQLPSIIYVDDVNVEGRTLYISPQIESILGFTPQEWQENSPGLWSQQVHPDDLERVHAEYIRCFQDGEPLDYEYRIRASNGRLLWFRDQAVLLRDENGKPHLIQGMIYDITERKQAEESLRQRVMELELLYESGLAFIQLLHPKEIAQKIIQLLEQKMDWHHTAIRLYDRETNMLQLLAFNQPNLSSVEETVAMEEHLKGSVTRSAQGLSGWVVQHGQTVRADDVANDERYFETLPGMQSGLYVPIKLGDRVIGVISIESEQPNAFSDEDERLTNTLANQAASALENARLFDETRQRIMELTSLHRAGQTLLAARLNSEKIYAAVHQVVAQTMPCEAFVIVLDDDERGEYHAVYFFDSDERFPVRRLPREEGLSGRVISTGQTVLINDLNIENLHANHFGSSGSVRSILAVPLRRGDEIIGMLSTQSYQPHAFGEPQRILLETIGAQLSSALDNANLYQQTQARIMELETLHVISTSLRTIQTVDEALSIILDNTLAALKTDAGSILLYDPSSNELHDVVARGWFADLALKSFKVGEGVAGTVFATGEPYYSAELTRDALPNASTRKKIPEGWGGVCLPIQTSTEILGVMFVSVQLPGEINAQQIILLESLVDMAGAALHRMRLYDETARRAEEFASLYETSKALSAEYDLALLLKVIVDRTKAMLNSSTSGMYLFNSESQELELTMDTSPTIPIGSHLQLGEGVAGKVAETRQPLRIEDYSTWEGRSPKYENIPIHAVMEVPMLYAGKLIGVLTADEISDSGRKFTDADERLLSLFASQAAGAINSARQHAQTVRYAEELELRVSERTAEIEATRQRLDLATRAGGIGVWEVNLMNNRIFWDMHMHDIHGTDPAQFDNSLETWWQLIYPDDLERLQKKFQGTLQNNGVFSDEYRIVQPNGSLRYISSNAIMLYDEDHIPERMVGVNIDITERKHTEVALHVANLEMERAMRTKDEFLANMSHELRTPLNSILGISESLEEQISGPLNPKQLRYIGIVKESGRHLLELINDILDISKIEAGRMELNLQNVSVDKLCQSSLRMVRELAHKKSLKVSFEMINKVDVIFGDERRLKQSLVNMLSNAVKFTPSGGHIGLEVCGYPQENEVTFTVWDKGIGIAQEDIKLLFQPFAQLDSGLSREYQGTGLGLALVAQMMRLHGGRVGLESQEGEGSRFMITLPWLPEHQNAHDKSITEPRPVPRSETKRNGRILLVEDTEVIVSFLTEYLQYKGYQVLIAHTGMEGVLLAKQEYPDLIIMDVMMPIMDGFEATKNIREVDALMKTPIIALTALAMPGDRERCLAAGMSDYLSKPIRIQELADMIEKHLTSKGQPLDEP